MHVSSSTRFAPILLILLTLTRTRPQSYATQAYGAQYGGAQYGAQAYGAQYGGAQSYGQKRPADNESHLRFFFLLCIGKVYLQVRTIVRTCYHFKRTFTRKMDPNRLHISYSAKRPAMMPGYGYGGGYQQKGCRGMA